MKFQFLENKLWVRHRGSNLKTAHLSVISLPLPPDLDIFGIILYSVLTFMAAVSMLVYLEECVYIYKKVPANKKSVIIWVNGAAPVRIT